MIFNCDDRDSANIAKIRDMHAVGRWWRLGLDEVWHVYAQTSAMFEGLVVDRIP